MSGRACGPGVAGAALAAALAAAGTAVGYAAAVERERALVIAFAHAHPQAVGGVMRPLVGVAGPDALLGAALGLAAWTALWLGWSRATRRSPWWWTDGGPSTRGRTA